MTTTESAYGVVSLAVPKAHYARNAMAKDGTIAHKILPNKSRLS